MKTLFYIHDPMCAWCWGFRPVWQQTKAHLQQQHPALTVQYILGGLAPDTNQPMPTAMQRYIRANWTRIQEVIPETVFDEDFWDVC